MISNESAMRAGGAFSNGSGMRAGSNGNAMRDGGVFSNGSGMRVGGAGDISASW